MLAVTLSTIGTLETSILQFTRTMYAKGRDGALHPRYAILHKSWKTPWMATAVIACMWHFRSSAFSSAPRFVFQFLWPAASAAFLTFIATYSIPTFDLTTNILGLGGIAIGVIPWAMNRPRAAPASANASAQDPVLPKKEVMSK